MFKRRCNNYYPLYLGSKVSTGKIMLFFCLSLLLVGCAQIRDSLTYIRRDAHLTSVQKLLFFPPVVEPEIPEIQQPAGELFRAALTDAMEERYRQIQIKFIDVHLPYHGPEAEIIAKFSANNEAQAVVIPHIKFVKMGVGSFISRQVIVTFRLYNHRGDYLMETGYDTTVGNANLRQTATSSLRYGVRGCLRKMFKEIRNHFKN